MLELMTLNPKPCLILLGGRVRCVWFSVSGLQADLSSGVFTRAFDGPAKNLGMLSKGLG